ncbi:MAG: AbrB/MazE/SpoVT family DNA-binding domain-containing protein [Alphaproteobacteria bacterium]
MQHLKVRKIGNSLGVVLPKETLAQLGVGEGDELILSDAPDGEMRITRGEVDLDRQLEAARRGMKRYRNALRELAK